VERLKDNVCRCNKTPVPGSQSRPIEVEELEYHTPRVATPVIPPEVLVPIDAPISAVGSRVEIARDPPADRAEDPPKMMAEDRVSRVARVSISYPGRIESNSKEG